MKLEVLFSPAEFAALSADDLSGTTCVVIDVLRATSTMVTALANGAESIIPVAEIAEALAWRRQRSDVLLAGERGGLRIDRTLTGGVEFDLGNSPREYRPEVVAGKTIVMTTTNGTRALRACAAAGRALISSFLNLEATANWLNQEPPADLRLVCSGTLEHAALEDALAAGALCERIRRICVPGEMADSAEIACRLYAASEFRLNEAMQDSRNGRRLLAKPDLCGDVEFCLRRDTIPLVAALAGDGAVRKLVEVEG